MQKLAALSGPTKGTIYALADDSVSVGRADGNTIVIEDTEISRHHALLSRAGDDYRVRDLNSANGTFVNGQRVTEALLEPGDTLEMGTVRFTYRPDSPQRPGPRRSVPTASRPTAAPATLAPAPAPAAVASGTGGPLGSAGRTAPVVPALPVPAPVPSLQVGPVAPRRPGTLMVVVVTSVVCWLLGGLVWWGSGRFFGNGARIPARAVPAVAAAPGPLPQPAAPAAPAAVAASAAGREYRDGRGRFACRVPVGWAIEEEREEGRSNVRFHRGQAEVRVIAQSTDQPELGERDRDAARRVFAEIADRAGATNAAATKLATTWRDLAGWRALQVDLELDQPGFLWMRQIKFRREGVDHTIAAYAATPPERAEVERLFEEFLAAYRPGAG